MKRRFFCGSALATVATALPLSRLLAAAESSVASDVPALSGDGKQIVLPRGDVAELRASLGGQLLIAGDAGYDQARKVWNGSFNRKPALIARCAGASDVIKTVNFARAHSLLTSVRGGGHSISGQSVCEGGLMIDLAPMDGVRVDPVARRARVDGGALLGSLDREAQAFGLATTAGTVSHTGVGGLTLGGGFGRLGRKFSMACDNVRAYDIVTADGKFLRVSAEENTDLNWGLRGGGGNFGVVTSFEFELYPVNPVLLGGVMIYPIAQAKDVLNFFDGFYEGAPDELYVDTTLVTDPVDPEHPKILVLDATYCGSIADGERVLKPLREFRKPVVDAIAPIPYVKQQSSVDDAFAYGHHYYVKAGFVRRLPPELVEAMIETFMSSTLPITPVLTAPQGGAISRIAPDATAYPYRDARHNLLIAAKWPDSSGDEAHLTWARNAWKTLEPFTRGFYVNDNNADISERKVLENYGPNYPRLAQLKAKYDPTNLFRLNANIKPHA
jgi:FAD/FMN-containing dehydrogenase